MMGCCNGMGMGMGGGLWLVSFLVVMLVIGGLAFVLIRHRAAITDRLTGPSPAWGGGRARAVLEERYARGEISTEEFQERLRVLRNSRRDSRPVA